MTAPRKKRDRRPRIRYVEIVLSTGMHLRCDPEAQHVQFWDESPNGHMGPIGRCTLDTFIGHLEALKHQAQP